MSPELDLATINQLVEHLNDLFELGAVKQFKLFEGGYMCQNYDLVSERGHFFLKQYRHRFSHRVSEMKKAERFFAERGFPVILPINDRHGRDTFWFQGNWYSLFPFIEAQSPKAHQLTPAIFESLAAMLAQMHQVGLELDFSGSFYQLHLWNSDAFELEYIELEQTLLAREQLNDLDREMLANLRLKRDIISRNKLKPSGFPLSNDRLLHGDFIYQNTFVDEQGAISHIYDFEKVCLGPRAYDLARAILINCFDDGWTDKNFQQARIFLNAYRQIYPIDQEEFLSGLKMYLIHITHMTWMEAKYILFGSRDYLRVYQANMSRIKHLSGHELDFVRQIFI
ncbi:phosphotransferase [Patescibacteria group bacterium]|nr:phosphotransferase [Patescibacteria group bacterium]MBU1705289.1 phosphotransferase [Patescibacteria group bacterium]